MKLKERLLEIGGTSVVWMPDPDLEMVAKDGREFSIVGRKMIAGQHNRCHQNTADNFLRRKKMSIATGYALSNDGKWRQHSFGVELVKKKEVVIESAVKFERYFGAILDGMMTAKFIFGELGDAVMIGGYDQKRVMKMVKMSGMISGGVR